MASYHEISIGAQKTQIDDATAIDADAYDDARRTTRRARQSLIDLLADGEVFREGAEQGPALEDRSVGVTTDRQQVVKQPRVLDLRDRVRLSPDAQHVVVADLLRGGRDPEADSAAWR